MGPLQSYYDCLLYCLSNVDGSFRTIEFLSSLPHCAPFYKIVSAVTTEPQDLEYDMGQVSQHTNSVNMLHDVYKQTNK